MKNCFEVGFVHFIDNLLYRIESESFETAKYYLNMSG